MSRAEAGVCSQSQETRSCWRPALSNFAKPDEWFDLGRDAWPQILRSPDGQVRCGAPGRACCLKGAEGSLDLLGVCRAWFGFWGRGVRETMGDACWRACPFR